MTATVEEAAGHQVVFREVNERIAEVTGGWSETGVRLVVCECSDPECAEALQIGSSEYERVRADGARFVVLPGHELPGVERVVDRDERFLVVEKIGTAAEIARTNDPRRRV